MRSRLESQYPGQDDPDSDPGRVFEIIRSRSRPGSRSSWPGCKWSSQLGTDNNTGTILDFVKNVKQNSCYFVTYREKHNKTSTIFLFYEKGTTKLVGTILRFCEKGLTKQVILCNFSRKVQQNRFYFVTFREGQKKTGTILQCGKKG